MSSMLTFMKTDHQREINIFSNFYYWVLGSELGTQGRNQSKRGQFILCSEREYQISTDVADDRQCLSSMLTFMKIDHQREINIFSNNNY